MNIQNLPPRKDADFIPVRMCNKSVFCPRSFHLEFVQGVFIESADTVAGRAEHERAERRGTKKKVEGAQEAAEGAGEDDAWRRICEGIPPRSMVMQSEAWGVSGKFDFVELDTDEVVVVESKHGKAPKTDEHEWNGHVLPYRAWPPDVVQVGLYMALLRENGLPCHRGRIYYRGSHDTVEVAWSDDLERFLRDVVAEARAVAQRPVPPEPLVDSPKCIGCSLHDACLPDEHAALRAFEQGEGAPEVRRIVAARDDRAVVHVTSPGTVVRKNGEALLIVTRAGETTRIPLIDVQHVALFGRVSITEPCLQHLLRCGIGISHHTGGGRILGYTAPLTTVNIGIRRAQFRAADDETTCRTIARALVLSKLHNQRTVLRRYRRKTLDYADDEQQPMAELPAWAATGEDRVIAREDASAPDPWQSPPPSEDPLPGAADSAEATEEPRSAARDLAEAIRRIGIAIDAARRAATVDEIRGHEGDGAAVYFGALPLILPAPFRGDFGGRTRRPPRDRVNALLSFGYALLVREATAACARIGLDPMLGFLHTMLPGRPALALDLMEPFRAAWVDTAILRLLATGGIDRADFHVSLCGVTLSDKGRRALIAAYERRANELTTHPRFGYRMSYRRMLELEARVLAKVLLGELTEYRPMWTR